METCKIYIKRNDDGTATGKIEGSCMDLVNMLGSIMLQDESFRSIVFMAVVASEKHRKKGNKDGKRTVN